MSYHALSKLRGWPWGRSTAIPAARRKSQRLPLTAALRLEALEQRCLLSGVPQEVPYVEDFSGGLPGSDAGWEYASTAEGRIALVGGQLRMDDSVDGGAYSRNEAIVHVDLTDKTNIELTLDHQEMSDEDNVYAGDQFTGSVDADLIAVSVDGTHWVKVSDLGGSFTGRVFALDAKLDEAAAAAGVSDRADVRIKLQQYDNYAWDSDGRAFDNVQVNWIHPQPEMEVWGGGLEIATGDSTPSLADQTHFGTAGIDGQTITRTFTIRNTGTADLALTGSPTVVVTGTQAGDFSVDVQPGAAVVPGGETTLEVTFDPSAAGTRRATVQIANDDADENPYVFAIEGVCIVAQAVPYGQDFSGSLPGSDAGWEYASTAEGRIALVGGQLRMDDSVDGGAYSRNEAIVHVDLTDKTNIELTLDHQDMSDEDNVYAGDQFTGSVDADLIAVSVDGTHWVKVSDLGGSFTGRVFALDARLDEAAAAAGVSDRADVRIKLQQYDNYAWDSDGRAFDNVQVDWIHPQPEMEVWGGGLEIATGDSTPSLADQTHFGTAGIDGQTITRTFTIRNTGTADLALTGSPTVVVTGTQAGDFSVDVQPGAAVVPGGETTLQVTFDPSAAGTRRATVQIANDDADENPYVFAIEGVCIVAQSVPYGQDFSGSLPGSDAGWEYASTAEGRIALVGGQLRMDDSVDGGAYSRNEAIVHVDLTDKTNIELTLDHQDMSDEDNVYAGDQFTGSVDADLIAVSVDGTHWVKVSDLGGSFTGRILALDAKLDEAAAAAGVSDRADVRIKLQQYDNYAWDSDGRAFDNVQVNWIHPQPEMEVWGGGLEIATGDSTPSLADQTHFGTAGIDGQTITRTFTIRNTGTADLALTGSPTVVVTGTQAGDFSVDVQPGAAVVPGGETTLEVTFDPSAAGTRRATVQIANDDADENPYEFAIEGVCIVAQAVPYGQDFSGGLPGSDAGWEYASTAEGRIALVGGQLRMDDSVDGGAYSRNEAIVHVDLTDKTNIELTLDHQDMSDEDNVYAGDQFTGSVDADLIAVSVDGTHWVKVSDLGGSFTGRVFALDAKLDEAAAAAGVSDRADVRIKLQQYDNYAWDSDGRAFDNVQVDWIHPQPEMEVWGGGLEIATGDSTPSLADQTHFGTAGIDGQTITRTFTIRNTGTADLALTGSPTVVVTGTHAGDFSVDVQPGAAVVPGGETTLQVTFDPSAAGTRRATVQIANDDADENPYVFAIEGVCIVAQSVPHAQGFSGSLPGGDAGWEYASTAEGRIALVGGQLRMDDAVSGGAYSRNEAIVHVDLTDKVNVALILDHQDMSDEDNVYAGDQFTGSVDADLIAVSVDGTHWVKVSDLGGSFTGRILALDAKLDEAAAAAGVSDRADVRIKLQQYDNYPWDSDGRAFDNVQVTDGILAEVGIHSIAWGGSGQVEMKKQGGDSWENDPYTVRGDRTIPNGLDAPVWLDANGDGDARDSGDIQEPVAFVRGAQPALRTTLLTPATTEVWVRATSTDTAIPLIFNGSGLAADGSVNVNLTTSQDVGAAIRSGDITLRWEASANGVVYQPIGESDHHLFVLYDQPLDTTHNSPTARRIRYGAELAAGEETIMDISQVIAYDAQSRFSYFDWFENEDAWGALYTDADCGSLSWLQTNALRVLGVWAEVRAVYAVTGSSWDGLWSHELDTSRDLGYMAPLFLGIHVYNNYEGCCYVSDGQQARYYLGGVYGDWEPTAYDVLMTVTWPNTRAGAYQAYWYADRTPVPYPTAPPPVETPASYDAALLAFLAEDRNVG